MASTLDSDLTRVTNPTMLTADEDASLDIHLVIADIQAYAADPSSGTGSITSDSATLQADLAVIQTACS